MVLGTSEEGSGAGGQSSPRWGHPCVKQQGGLTRNQSVGESEISLPALTWALCPVSRAESCKAQPLTLTGKKARLLLTVREDKGPLHRTLMFLMQFENFVVKT